jgi:hypothetical protein
MNSVLDSSRAQVREGLNALYADILLQVHVIENTTVRAFPYNNKHCMIDEFVLHFLQQMHRTVAAPQLQMLDKMPALQTQATSQKRTNAEVS